MQYIVKGVNIPVLKVAIGSFDTHSDQFWRHRDLLRELDELSETAKALQDIGIWNDTVIMTYSNSEDVSRKMALGVTMGWLPHTS